MNNENLSIQIQKSYPPYTVKRYKLSGHVGQFLRMVDAIRSQKHAHFGWQLMDGDKVVNHEDYFGQICFGVHPNKSFLIGSNREMIAGNAEKQ